MNMKIKTIIFLLLFAGGLCAQQLIHYDTLESGSSDSIKTFQYEVPEAVVSVSYYFQQLDTNGAAAGGSPDSVLAFHRYTSGTVTSPFMPVDFNETNDSLFHYLTFSYAVNTAGQIRSGWLWKPGVYDVTFQMYNRKYLTNRRVVVWVKFNTQ